MSCARKLILAVGIMRAIRVSQFGGPDVLQLQSNVSIPKPKPSEVLIQVKAIGVNPVDAYIRSGTYAVKPPLPYTPGSDSAGVVVEAGCDVTAVKKGDRVFSLRSTSGTYAEYAVSEGKFIGVLDDNVTFEQGAGLGVPYFTAYRALMLRANAKPGETILVHGASGAVGTASVQIAKAMGMRVVGTAGSEEGMKVVKENGADDIFNHREDGYTTKIISALGGEGPDIILEMLANVNLEKDLEMIKAHGRIICIGSRGTIEISPRYTMAKECTVTGVMLMQSLDAEWKVMHDAISAGMKQGWVKPHIGKIISLENASEAHDFIINNSGTQGNIVLKP